MKNKIMKSLVTLIALIVAALCCFCSGCGNGNNDGEVNTDWSGMCWLEPAYENNYITKSDLEQLAYNYNNNILSTQILTENEISAIKEAAAEYFRTRENNAYPEAVADNFTIEKIYGVFSGCYAIIIDSDLWAYPADVPDYWTEIDGVAFHHTSHGSIAIFKLK